MSVIYALVGYDKQTARMVLRVALPPSAIPLAKQIAGISCDDDTQVGDWELDMLRARDIAGLFGQQPAILPDLDFFLEPYVSV
ncbi:MAG TPA: hypothetical protein VJ732_19310 [Bryobacteraceae bacterium]|nr:hypothetical protein [Bryobacteraceae bacterium]